MGSEQRLQGGEDPSLPIDEGAVTIEGQQVEVGRIQHGASLLRPLLYCPRTRKENLEEPLLRRRLGGPSSAGRYARADSRQDAGASKVSEGREATGVWRV